jgi:hypothetical protein
VRRPIVELLLQRDTISAQLRDRHAVMWKATAEYAGAADLAEVIAGLVAAEEIPPGARLEVRVAPPLLQVRHLEALPPVRTDQLVELVGHHPGKYFRKNGHPLVTDVAWATGRRMVAIGVALEEQYAAAVLAGAREAGLAVGEIVPDVLGLPVLSLLPASERIARRRGVERWIRRGMVLAAMSWLVVGATTVISTIRESRRVDRELAALEAPVAAVVAAQRELDGAISGIAAVESPVEERFSAALTLGRLVVVLPDSTWLTAATFREDGRGELSVMAARPAAVLAKVQRTGLLVGPRIEGRTTGEAVGGRRTERFTIRFGAEGTP